MLGYSLLYIGTLLIIFLDLLNSGVNLFKLSCCLSQLLNGPDVFCQFIPPTSPTV
jgi:hypothetical protein